MQRDAPHCLIKQKVDLFKSNFAQGLGGGGGEQRAVGRGQQTGPRAKKGTAGPREAVRRMPSSLKHPGSSLQPLPSPAGHPLTQWQGRGRGAGRGEADTAPPGGQGR